MTPQERKAAELELFRLSEERDGHITARELFEIAKADKDSPLRPIFEWNKSKAFEAHNVDRGRRFIASVNIIKKTHKIQVRCVAYVRNPNAPADEQGYLSIDRVKTEADMRRDVLLAEFKRIGGLLKRARRMAKYFEAEQEVEALIANLDIVRQSFEVPTQQ